MKPQDKYVLLESTEARLIAHGLTATIERTADMEDPSIDLNCFPEELKAYQDGETYEIGVEHAGCSNENNQQYCFNISRHIDDTTNDIATDLINEINEHESTVTALMYVDPEQGKTSTAQGVNITGLPWAYVLDAINSKFGFKPALGECKLDENTNIMSVKIMMDSLPSIAEWHLNCDTDVVKGILDTVEELSNWAEDNNHDCLDASEAFSVLGDEVLIRRTPVVMKAVCMNLFNVAHGVEFIEWKY